MLCHAISEQIVYSRHKIILSQQQPSIGPTWIHFKLVRGSVLFAVVPRLECSTQNMHQITCANSFSRFYFFFQNQKAKGRHLTPTVSLVRMRRVSRDTLEQEKNNGFQDRAKFHIRLWNWMIFLPTIVIIRKCYLYVFAHFHDTIVHIMLIFPCLGFKKTHLEIH